ncbi:hypothetical protein SLG_18540 [Sphingobium sp. SYK-6]|nr:hypothetical protein SLG_18540 [Sphingobium sp. SYK-6]
MPRRPSEERDILDKSATVRALVDRDIDKLIRARADRQKAFRDLIIEILADCGF